MAIRPFEMRRALAGTNKSAGYCIVRAVVVVVATTEALFKLDGAVK